MARRILQGNGNGPLDRVRNRVTQARDTGVVPAARARLDKAASRVRSKAKSVKGRVEQSAPARGGARISRRKGI